MGFREWLSDNGIFEVKRVPQRKRGERSLEVRERAVGPDELALGHALVEQDGDKDTFRLKGVPQKDRDTHFYVVGASGSGKTRFLETLAVQDIAHGNGFGIIDAHGDFADDIKEYVFWMKRDDSAFLRENVIVIDPTDPERTACFNPLERTDGVSPDGIAAEAVEAFKKIWADAWGARMEDLLKNSLVALIENDLTLAELPPFITNPALRRSLLSKVRHPMCRQYFERYDTLSPHTQNEWSESTLNKVNAFLFDTSLRQMFLSPKSTFSLRDVMDNRKILIVRLDRGRLKGSADLLGSLLLSKIQSAAFSRTDVPEASRVPFYLYIDEFQNFATESFVQTLAEARKYKLSLTLAHQNLAQLPASLRAAILGNCGLQAYFRMSRADADILAKESLAAVYENPPGWEFYVQKLQEAVPRMCIVRNRNGNGVAEITTLPMPPAREAAGVPDFFFAGGLNGADIGGAHLRPRVEIEEEYRKRREKLLGNSEAESFRERRKNSAADYEAMIRKGESDSVEFKASLRVNYQTKSTNKTTGYILARAISSFMNSEGGILFIGVHNSGEILGVESDYLTFKNKDGFLLELTNIINKYLGKEYNQYASVEIVPIKGKDVCIVRVAASALPVYLRTDNNDGKEEFHVRASASSQSMTIKEANAYIGTHFRKQRKPNY